MDPHKCCLTQRFEGKSDEDAPAEANEEAVEEGAV